MATFLKDDQNILIRDQNRYRKIYRYIRKKKRPLLCDGSDVSHFTWGTYFVPFNHQCEVEHFFPCCYENPPAIVATSVSRASSVGTWTDADGAGAANATYKFSNLPTGPTNFNYAQSTSATVNGATVQSYLNNLWWDFSNADGTVWRIQVQGSGYPSAHDNPSVSRSVDKTFVINVATSGTLGAWITSFISLAGSVTVSGEKFTDKWNITTTDSPADITFTAKTGNKGPLADLADPNPATGPDWVDTYSYEKSTDTGSVPDSIAIQTGANDGTGSTGSGTSSVVATNPNFNVFVTDISANKCTFRTSGYFTGYVYYQALVDGAYTMPNIGKSLEVKTLIFDGTNDFVTYPFTAEFSCEPTVTVTADEDVNAFVSAVSKSSVTVEVSKASYTGKIYLQAIEKGC